MAEYYGVELKALKSSEGEDGPYYSGNLYLKNRKIAYWSQDSRGRIDDKFIFSQKYSYKKFEQLIRKKCPKIQFPDGNLYPCTPEDFMENLLNITLTENDFKKCMNSPLPCEVFYGRGI